MASFNTVFKKVYGEALEPYGFVKLKGRQPYFVKLIGDEILVVISYKNEWSPDNSKQAFNILGGVETVYRRSLSLDKTPRDNTQWMNDNFSIYGKLHKYDYKQEEGQRILDFKYEKGNEDDMLATLNYSLDVTKELLLPELLKVTDIKSCVEFYRFYHGSLLNIYTDETFGQKWGGSETNEGLLNLKIYNLEEYIEIENKNFKEWLKYYTFRMNTAGSVAQKEAFEKLKEELEEGMNNPKVFSDFEQLYNDPVQYARAMEELERRKTENLKILRLYGFEV